MTALEKRVPDYGIEACAFAATNFTAPKTSDAGQAASYSTASAVGRRPRGRFVAGSASADLFCLLAEDAAVGYVIRSTCSDTLRSWISRGPMTIAG